MSQVSEKSAAHGLNPYRHLSEDERIRKIGELLATAALRYLRSQPAQSPRNEPPDPVPVPVWDLVEDELERQILRYLAQQVAAPPVAIGKALNLHSKCLERRLARLRSVGLVIVYGKTRNAYYSLSDANPRN